MKDVEAETEDILKLEEYDESDNDSEGRSCPDISTGVEKYSTTENVC